MAPKSPFSCVNRSSIRNSCRVGPKAIQYTVNTARVKATMTMTKTGTTVQLATHCFSRALHFARLFWRSCYRQSYDVSRWIWILSARMCFSKSIKIWAFWKDICILFLCFCPLFSNNHTPLSQSRFKKCLHRYMLLCWKHDYFSFFLWTWNFPLWLAWISCI